MTMLLQISDTHILPSNLLMSNKLETSEPMARLVEHLKDSKPRFEQLDGVIVTGDLSEDGSAESYARFKVLLAPLALPTFVIPGNHDKREALRNAFIEDGYFPESGKLNWHQKFGHVNVIGLDSLIEGEGSGALDDDTLDFLDKTLRQIGGEPILLAMHHPPFKTGIAFMDQIGIKSTTRLLKILELYEGEIRIICGHVHSTMISCVAGCIAISAPSSCSTFAFDTRQDAPVGFFDEGDGALVHRWDKSFTSVRVGPTLGVGPHSF